jgi:hypothetical protein
VIYAIEIDTDQPLADQSVVNAAQAIAEELEEAGGPYRVIVKTDGRLVTAWGVLAGEGGTP